jgi:hypothetical protein
MLTPPASQLGVARWGLGMIGVGGLVGVVTCSVGGLGTGLVRLIVPSLRAGVTPDAFQPKRLLVVLCRPECVAPGTDNHALNLGLRMSW